MSTSGRSSTESSSLAQESSSGRSSSEVEEGIAHCGAMRTVGHGVREGAVVDDGTEGFSVVVGYGSNTVGSGSTVLCCVRAEL